MYKIGRNDPCHCGSGKKYKKCCMSKVPREQFIYFGHHEKFQGLSFDRDEVSAILPSGERQKVDWIFSQMEYARASKSSKILYSIPGNAVLDLPSHLASHLDVFFAVDTNTKQIGEHKVSASSILQCRVKKINQEQIQISTDRVAAIIFMDAPNGLAEKYSWAAWVDMICSSPNYKDSLRIAFITDHDLNSHSKLNAGELPIIGNFYLPNNITLLYASSDVGKENILNSLISMCDKHAKSILVSLEKDKSVMLGNRTISLDEVPTAKPDKFSRKRNV